MACVFCLRILSNIVDKEKFYDIIVLYCREYQICVHGNVLMYTKQYKVGEEMENRSVYLSSEKFKRERWIKKVIILALFFVFLMLILMYFVFGIVYNNGNFSVTLDQNLYFDKGLIIYDDPVYKVYRTELYAEAPSQFDNVSHTWLPKDIDELGGGSHNGKNYLAYTFYVENQGTDVSDYWSEVVIDDVINNIDEAVRVRIYRNGEYVTYAKARSDGTNEPQTVQFSSENLVVRNHIENFKPGDIDRYTMVLWIEGNDPECTDNILGGEFKIHMDFKSEHNQK